jgi:monoamine oxidase
MTAPFSRRHFLNLVGAAGGSAAVYQMSVALGLIPAIAAADTPRAELRARPQGRRVAVLGAGISGLVCAYELERAGYDVTVIEASPRIGGRNLTVRRGDLIDEMGNPQTCQFDDHPNLYFNCGPARIPAHHEHLLHYCKNAGRAAGDVHQRQLPRLGARPWTRSTASRCACASTWPTPAAS